MAERAEPLVVGMWWGSALAWPAPEGDLLLGHLGHLWVSVGPMASLEPIGQWARFAEGSTSRAVRAACG